MTYGIAPQETSTKKPVHKRWWFWPAIILLALFAFALNVLYSVVTNPNSPAPTVTVTQTVTPPVESNAVETGTDPETGPASGIPKEWENALKSGQSIADRNNSKIYVYRTLTSDVFGFPDDAAQYAVDNITDEWNERALNAAKEIQDRGNSHEYVRRTLGSDVYGFTDSEVDYAITNLEP